MSGTFYFLIFYMEKSSTKKCRACQADIPVGAKVCQHCKAKQGSWFTRHWIISTILVLIVFNTMIQSNNTTGVIQASPQKQAEIKKANELLGKIEINNIRIADNIIGVKELSFGIKNNTGRVLDAVDVKFGIENNYWESLWSESWSMTVELQPGKTFKGLITMVFKGTGTKVSWFEVIRAHFKDWETISK